MSWDGLMLIHKPAGKTSHAIVQMLRERLDFPKAGHLGTLDPLATGVFPVCLGKATRLAPFYMGADKTYIVKIRFGFFTTTDDREGEPEGAVRDVSFSREELKKTLASLQGEYHQKPPAFSAKKIKGRKAYQLARKGSKPELPTQSVNLWEIRLLHFEKKTADVFVHCSSGTYVRSLVRELGVRLSCGAHVTELERTKFGSFTLEQTCNPEASLDTLRSCFIPVSEMLSDFPEVILNPDLSKKILNGSPIELDQLLERDWVRLFNEDKSLIAFAHVEPCEKMQRIQPRIVFH